MKSMIQEVWLPAGLVVMAISFALDMTGISTSISESVFGIGFFLAAIGFGVRLYGALRSSQGSRWRMLPMIPLCAFVVMVVASLLPYLFEKQPWMSKVVTMAMVIFIGSIAVVSCVEWYRRRRHHMNR